MLLLNVIIFILILDRIILLKKSNLLFIQILY